MYKRQTFEQLVDYCKEAGLFLIEDTAQALGSTYKGKALGTFGDIGSFSFSMPKIITAGQGGAVITQNPDFYNKMLKIRDFGREKAGSDHYLMIGGNFKYTDIPVSYTHLVNGFRGSIGNLVYENITLDEQKKLFEQMELIGFFLISILTTGYVACCQTAVELWMGQESLLPVAFLVITVLVKYVAGVQQIVYLYRLAFGKYDEDRNAMLLSAVLNVVLSIAGAQMYGVTGVALGTFCLLYTSRCV